MSEHILKRHNKNLLLYHLICPAKYRRKVFGEVVEATLKQTCLEIIQPNYELHFVEIGTDEDHVHFLIQSVPMMLPAQMVRIIKSITARTIFSQCPEVKKSLWGGHFWTSGYYLNTVGRYGNEQVIARYVKEQGKEYRQIHRDQLTIF